MIMLITLSVSKYSNLAVQCIQSEFAIFWDVFFLIKGRILYLTTPKVKIMTTIFMCYDSHMISSNCFVLSLEISVAYRNVHRFNFFKSNLTKQ